MEERIGKNRSEKKKDFWLLSKKSKYFSEFEKEFEIAYWLNGNNIRGNSPAQV